ncbi:hypothetical protein [Novosphingobium acidiphilum]|uniref:hypothetical protein n=1 Tax=Novosphingobium acidiphilum TaxID=505248 RepID=UPI0003F8A185|nr:hypothetical protein [Novosphingobium acidiphilum]
MASSIGQARAQAAAADANAQAESNAAQIGQQNMRDAALQQYRQIAAVTGQQRMLAAASGDAVGYGTSANAQDDTRILGQENLARIYAQGDQNLMGSDVSVANDLGQAAVASNRANAALVGGLFNLGSGLAGSGVGLFGAGSAPSATALGGASQYASFKTGMGL